MQGLVNWLEIERKAAEVFGVTALRPGQRELIEAVLAGRDAFGIMPTGSGKSLCFQLASLFLPKQVVVVTPLISLGEDQTEKLDHWRVSAMRIDSTLRAAAERDALAGIAGGRLELVYTTPERLATESFLDLLIQGGVSLLVIDEAHCISEWGHDFRPAFLAIRHAADRLGRPPILALTATATPAVQRDVMEQLGLRDPAIVRRGCERPNIRLAVSRADEEVDKRTRLSRLLETEPGSTIVYTSTIRTAEQVHADLLAANLPAGLYHGKLLPAVRDATQMAFMDGRYRILVATKAFGMGIDKPNTRLVVHYEVPDSLESYYQEVGRAGRDGLPANAVLLYRPADARVQRFFQAHRYPSCPHVERVVAVLATSAAGVPIELANLGKGQPERKRSVLLADLERLGVIALREDTVTVRDPARLVRVGRELREHYEELRKTDRARLDAMLHYAELVTCRTAEILRYFGETAAWRCEHCDNCEEQTRWIQHR